MIINIVGPCDAGKTTLAWRLSKNLGLPVYSIADFRACHESEIKAWYAIREKIDLEEGIIDSTGLNHRLYEIVLKNKEYLRIKLQCSIEHALKRAVPDEGTNFGMDFHTFVKRSVPAAQMIDADLVVDTDDLAEEEVVERALSSLGIPVKDRKCEAVMRLIAQRERRLIKYASS